MKRTISFIVALAIMATMCVGFTLNVAAAPVELVSHACSQTNHDAVSFSKTESNSVVMQSVTIDGSWLGIVFPGWGADDGTATVEVFAFDTDLATSAAGTALLTETGVVINQVTHNEHRFSTPLPSGDYVIKFSNFAGTCYLGYGDKVNAATLTSFENVGGPGTPNGHGLVISYIISRDPSTAPVTEVSVDSTSDFSSDILNARYTLVADLDASNTVAFSGCIAVIDLAGHTWDCSDVALDVDAGAEVTVIDSVGGGKVSANNDAIRTIGNGKLTLRGITVDAYAGSCDAVFTQGGVVLVEDCILNAKQASVHNDNSKGATVLVDGCTLNGEDVALKGRNNAVITITGNTVFNNRNVEMQRGFDNNRSVADTFKAGENATIEFDSIVVGNGVRTTVKNYTYTAPVETKLGASIEITNGIALDFVVSNAPANAVVKIDGVEFDVSYVDGQDSHYILDGFGPHTMGDEHTAELYVDGELFATKTYSVKKYCSAVIESTEASDAHKTLAKAILNYGAKAQVYADYDVENLVYNGNEFDNSYDPAEDVALILNDFADASANWVNANVKFGDTLELIINLEGEADNVDVTIGTESTTYEVLTTAAGTKYIVVTEITPDQFKTEIAAVAYNGDVRVSKTLTYSVGSYISDRLQNSTNQAYKDLVMALSIYGDAVAAFVA